MEQPNQSYINELSGGDQNFKEKLISIIKKEFPEEKKVYYSNFQAKKYKLAADNVHKLKHKISILGLEKSYDIAVDFENNLIEGHIDLNEKFDSILKNITLYLEDL